jgi:dephospho-CoA kinase
MIIGVAGTNGAGKGEVIKLLEERGYTAYSLSDSIRAVLHEKNLQETRERMIETGRALRAEGGPGVLAERLLSMMDLDRDYAVDSVRHPAEAGVLRESGRPFHLVWVAADEAIRFERIRARGRSGDPETLESLRELEGRELGSADPAAQQLDAVRESADITLRNDADMAALRSEFESMLTSIDIA